ncbi:hypothetical protein QYE76_011288 [Lolium multiflorum]|uniref:TF-B3 domain-containing protein n=1 Tax=Lolium multiflorum TaxID=4521 RepID=A0AAD8X2V9_LOLMU|nr:hypothetical protein QYE76_011288 [Lolium multiflorum]
MRPRSPRKGWWERTESVATVPVTTAIATIVARPFPCGFEFGVTIHQCMIWDGLRLPHRFASIVDGQDPHHVLLRVSDDATRLWSAEVMFDGEGQLFLHNGWRSFARTVEVGHFAVFKYDDHGVFTIKVFDETMTRMTRPPLRQIDKKDHLLGGGSAPSRHVALAAGGRGGRDPPPHQVAARYRAPSPSVAPSAGLSPGGPCRRTPRRQDDVEMPPQAVAAGPATTRADATAPRIWRPPRAPTASSGRPAHCTD